jgi:ASC-1-like (ASCH) protein
MRISDRAFRAIKSGRKKVEIRKYAQYGDEVTLVNNETGETIICKILRIDVYISLKEMISDLLKEYTFGEIFSSGANTVELGVESIEKIYKDIDKFCALHLNFGDKI